MESALIVSSAEKSQAYFVDMLSHNTYREITTVQSCGEAKRLYLSRDFDLCIINAPLKDEFGDEFALSIAEKGISQVLLVVKTELYDEISAKVEEMGVFTIANPIGRGVIWSALKMAGAAHSRISRLTQENKKLLQRIEDIRVIDRAKCILISHFKMSEPEAHKYIEKQAMDMRMTRRNVAESILKTYAF